VRSKFVINSDIIDEINTFSYLGRPISYQNEADITGKISKFLHITGIIKRILKPSQVQKHTTLTIYNTLAFPTLLYGSETWTIGEPDKCRMISAEIKFCEENSKIQAARWRSG
jgi:hypothetical protein